MSLLILTKVSHTDSWNVWTMYSMAASCSSLISCCPGKCSGIFWMISRWFPFSIWCHFSSTFHINCIYIVRYLYFKSSVSILITLIPPEFAMVMNRYVHFSLPLIMIPDILFGMVLAVVTFWFHNMGLPYFHDLYLLLLLPAHSVPCLVLLLFLNVCESAVEHPLYHVALYIYIYSHVALEYYYYYYSKGLSDYVYVSCCFYCLPIIYENPTEFQAKIC